MGDTFLVDSFVSLSSDPGVLHFYKFRNCNVVEVFRKDSTCSMILVMMTRKGYIKLTRSHTSTGLMVCVVGREEETER